MRLIVLVALMAVLAGCATRAQLEMARLMNSVESGKAASEACIAKVKETPEYRLLAPYLPEGSASLAAQANPAKATPAEIKAVFVVQEAGAECRKINLEGMGSLNPDMMALLAQAYAKVDAGYLGIVERKMTWGEFVRVREAARTEFLDQAMAIARQMDRELQAAHKAEVDEYKEAAKAILIWSEQQHAMYQRQKLIEAINRPRTTNCQYIGKRVTCTTF
ncbi:MAG: hypothetical protein J0H97_22970 [Alphaproteobacteria bacterium]|nr:hypothetical protein [Alphaproteobacteria bacterium]